MEPFHLVMSQLRILRILENLVSLSKQIAIEAGFKANALGLFVARSTANILCVHNVKFVNSNHEFVILKSLPRKAKKISHSQVRLSHIRKVDFRPPGEVSLPQVLLGF
jgi:hypothetical protein